MRFWKRLLAVLRALFLLLVGVRPGPAGGQLTGASCSGPARGGTCCCLVDCSASMNAQTGGVSSFDRAKAAVRKDRRAAPPRRPAHALPRHRADRGGFQPLSRRYGLDRGSHRFAQAESVAGQLFGGLRAGLRAGADRSGPAAGLPGDRLPGRQLARIEPADGREPLAGEGRTDRGQRGLAKRDGQRGHRGQIRRPASGPAWGCRCGCSPASTNYSKSQPADVTLSMFIDDKEVARDAAGDEARPDRRARVPLCAERGGRASRAVRNHPRSLSRRRSLSVRDFRSAANQGVVGQRQPDVRPVRERGPVSSHGFDLDDAAGKAARGKAPRRPIGRRRQMQRSLQVVEIDRAGRQPRVAPRRQRCHPGQLRLAPASSSSPGSATTCTTAAG